MTRTFPPLKTKKTLKKDRETITMSNLEEFLAEVVGSELQDQDSRESGHDSPSESPPTCPEFAAPVDHRVAINLEIT